MARSFYSDYTLTLPNLPKPKCPVSGVHSIIEYQNSCRAPSLWVTLFLRQRYIIPWADCSSLFPHHASIANERGIIMPKALGNLYEHDIKPFDAVQVLRTCLDTIGNLLFRSPLSTGSLVGRVSHTWIALDRNIAELPTTQMYESKTKEVRMKSLNKHPP